MDETKATQQDASGKNQDSSGGDEGSTSKEPQTFTEEQRDKAVQDALSAAGRDAKSIKEKSVEAEQILTNAKKTQEGIQAEQKRWQGDRDEAERETVKDDSEALKSLQERQRQRAKEAELARRAQELDAKEERHKGKLEEADKVTKELSARDIASKYNIDAESLVKFTDGSEEAMEELAQQLPKKGTPKLPLKTDAGTTAGGGGGIPTDRERFRDWIANMPQDQYEKLKPEIDKALAEGKIK